MNKKRNVYLMYAIVFLQGLVFYGSVATVYRQGRGISLYDIFLIESVSWVLMILLEVPWGYFADRFGYKNTIVISNIMYFISKIIFWQAHSFVMFLLERVFISVALSGISGCDSAILYSSIDEDKSEKVFGEYSAFSTAGFLVASVASSFIVKISVDLTAILTIFPYAAAAILSFFLIETHEEKEEKPGIKESFKQMFRNKEIILFIVSLALVTEVNQTVTVFLNQAQYSRSGIDIKYFGILLALIQIMGLGAAKSYKITERFGRRKIIIALYSIMALSCISLIFTVNAVISILCIMMVSVSIALMNPLAMDIENKSIIGNDRATMLSLYAIVSDVVSAFINPVLGKAADKSLQFSFALCAGLCVIAIGLFLTYSYKKSINKIVVDNLNKEI